MFEGRAGYSSLSPKSNLSFVIPFSYFSSPTLLTLILQPPLTPQTPHPMPFSLSQRIADEITMMSLSRSRKRTDQLENNESVVTSHGKICLWCNRELIIDGTDGRDDQSQPTRPNQAIISNQNQQFQHRHQEHQDQDQQDHQECQEPQYQHQDQQGCGQQHHGRQGHHIDHELAMQGVPADKMPPLLFRWSNRDSQGINSKTMFVAGLFCNGDWFDSEDCSGDRFEGFFRSHVSKQKVRTPFISTFRSPLAPLHRAIAGQNGAIVTVIDTSKLETKVFYAHPLAIRTGTLVYNGWQGYGEYLIWGRVPAEAIAFSVDIVSLEGITQSHRDLNRLVQIPLIRSSLRCSDTLRDMLALRRKSPFQSGRTLGKFLTLLQVPRIHWANLASEFARAWGWRNARETKIFYSGVKSAPPYLPEELTDSESEAPWPTPRKTPWQTPQKMHFSPDCVPDLDYEPPETDERSEGTSESEGVSSSQTMSMCDKTETADDGNFSTHETLSSGIFPENNGSEDFLAHIHSQEAIDLTSDNEDTSSQRALQRDWPSDDDTYMYPDTPTKIRGKISLHSDNKATYRPVLNGQMDMDFFEKFRLWT